MQYIRKYTTAGLVVIVLALITGIAFVWQKTQQPVKTVTVKETTITQSVQAKAFVKADKQADIAFPFTGRITTFAVKKGDMVQQGQFLAAVDATGLQKQKQQSLQDFMTTRWNFDETQHDTFKDQPPTDLIQREKDKSQFALDKSVLAVEIAQWNLSNSTLYAPFDGVVTDVSAEVGDVASPTVPVLTIQTTSILKIEAQITETGIGNVIMGNPVSMTMEAFPDTTFTGTVMKIDPASTTVAGNTVFLTDISTEQLPGNAKPGMQVDTTIITGQKQALAVPVHVLHNVKGNTATVTVLENDARVPKKVTLGMKGANGMVEVVSGLKAGDQVVDEL